MNPLFCSVHRAHTTFTPRSRLTPSFCTTRNNTFLTPPPCSTHLVGSEELTRWEIGWGWELIRSSKRWGWRSTRTGRSCQARSGTILLGRAVATNRTCQCSATAAVGAAAVAAAIQLRVKHLLQQQCWVSPTAALVPAAPRCLSRRGARLLPWSSSSSSSSLVPSSGRTARAVAAERTRHTVSMGEGSHSVAQTRVTYH